MKSFFECKVKMLVVTEEGKERKVSKNYLVDAVSFTDAETRIYEVMKETTRGEFQVMNIKKSNVDLIINDNVDLIINEAAPDSWFKAKIVMASIDENSGRECKITEYILVAAENIDQATRELHAGLSFILVPYELRSISLSPISEVVFYAEPEN